jgi:hypothetical protein
MSQHAKKIPSIVIFAFIFLSSFFVNTARAEVTCCGCETYTPSMYGERVAGRTTVNFACQDGSTQDCAGVCTRDNRESRPLEGVRANGPVVTCCVCRDDSKLCNGANQTCNTLCGDHGFRSGGQWRRYPETTTETTKDDEYKVELIPPTLNIDIPGTTNLFGGGEIVKEGDERYFYLPFIGQYAKAWYNYILSIVGILAVVVIIFAGAIWLTAGGSPERIKTAQEYIFGAVVGLVIAFGSYLILYTINPDLVRFGAMKLKVVERIPLSIPLEYTSDDLAVETTGEGIRGPEAITRAAEIRQNLVNIDFDCLSIAHPGVDPRLREPLQRVSERFCTLKGDNATWKILGGAYRSFEEAEVMFVRRCLYRAECQEAPTGSPYSRETIIRDEQNRRVPADPSLRARLENASESERINALRPFLEFRGIGHAGGLALDVFCSTTGERNRDEGTKQFYAPCQRALEQAFKDSGFCRLSNEGWHFEYNELRQTRTCNSSWTIGMVEGTGAYQAQDYRSCSNRWTYRNNQCRAR